MHYFKVPSLLVLKRDAIIEFHPLVNEVQFLAETEVSDESATIWTAKAEPNDITLGWFLWDGLFPGFSFKLQLFFSYPDLLRFDSLLSLLLFLFVGLLQ